MSTPYKNIDPEELDGNVFTSRTDVDTKLPTRNCPVCRQPAPVGGPHPVYKTWVIQAHGPDANTLCAGTDRHIPC